MELAENTSILIGKTDDIYADIILFRQNGIEGDESMHTLGWNENDKFWNVY